MRPLVAILIAVFVIGGVHTFLKATGNYDVKSTTAVDVGQLAARGTFAVDITLTFDAEADSFFADEPTSLLVRLGQTELLARADFVPAGTPLLIDPVPNIVQGRNEFYIQVIPRSEAEARSHAVRVRVLRDGQTIADETLWAEPGDPVTGRIVIDVPARAGGEDSHGHG